MKRKRRFIYTSVLVSLIAAAWAVIILPRSEYYTYESPSGEYKAIFTYRSYLSFIPMPPGSSGDKPGFVKVIDKTGHDYGELPLDMLNTAEFRWIKYGAKIFNGEWNFKETPVITGIQLVNIRYTLKIENRTTQLSQRWLARWLISDV